MVSRRRSWVHLENQFPIPASRINQVYPWSINKCGWNLSTIYRHQHSRGFRPLAEKPTARSCWRCRSRRVCWWGGWRGWPWLGGWPGGCVRGYTGAQVARWLARWLAGCGWLSCLSWLWLAEVKVSAFDMWMRLMRRMALLAGCGGWVAGWRGRRLAGWLAGWLGLGRGWPGGFMWLHASEHTKYPDDEEGPWEMRRGFFLKKCNG